MIRLQNAEKQLNDALLALESAANNVMARQKERDKAGADNAALGAEIEAIETRLTEAIALIDGAVAGPAGAGDNPMSQSVVTIRLNGQPYQIGCGAGEEAHVERLGQEADSVMQSLVASVGQIGEARLLAMVALILADRAASAATPSPENGTETDDLAAVIIEQAAERIAALASRLASEAVKS